MAEYIKIDKNTFPTFHKINVSNYAQGWNACLNSVLRHKTADVVEVVRCKDCKHYCLSDYRKPNEPKWCDLSNEQNEFPKPNDFCSYGERKDGDV